MGDQLPSGECLPLAAQYSVWMDQQKGLKQYPPVSFDFTGEKSRYSHLTKPHKVKAERD
jgi:hypothetical protein